MIETVTPDILFYINDSLFVKRTRSSEPELLPASKALDLAIKNGGVYISASTKPGVLIRLKGNNEMITDYFETSPVEVLMFEGRKFPGVQNVRIHKERVFLIRAIECKNGFPSYVEFLYIPREINEDEKRYLCEIVFDSCKKLEFHDAREPIIPYSPLYRHLRGIHDDWAKTLNLNREG